MSLHDWTGSKQCMKEERRRILLRTYLSWPKMSKQNDMSLSPLLQGHVTSLEHRLKKGQDYIARISPHPIAAFYYVVALMSHPFGAAAFPGATARTNAVCALRSSENGHFPDNNPYLGKLL